MRMAFSYPAVDQLIMWNFMGELWVGQPEDTVYLERYLNQNSSEFAHYGYPGKCSDPAKGKI